MKQITLAVMLLLATALSVNAQLTAQFNYGTMNGAVQRFQGVDDNLKTILTAEQLNSAGAGFAVGYTYGNFRTLAHVKTTQFNNFYFVTGVETSYRVGNGAFTVLPGVGGYYYDINYWDRGFIPGGSMQVAFNIDYNRYEQNNVQRYIIVEYRRTGGFDTYGVCFEMSGSLKKQ